jgi:hypothetical protein
LQRNDESVHPFEIYGLQDGVYSMEGAYDSGTNPEDLGVATITLTGTAGTMFSVLKSVAGTTAGDLAIIETAILDN